MVQGLTEFLPVSSSGHLVVFERLLKFEQPPLLTTVVLHLGTLVATAIVFRKDLLALLLAAPRVFRRRRPGEPVDVEARLLVMLVVGSIPTAAIGLLFRDAFERMFSSVAFVGVGFLVTALVLFLTGFTRAEDRRTLERATVLDAIVIGVAQGIAITPGVSRSGSTIATALFLGLDRGLAGRFSFLLSLPAVLGANVLELKHVADEGWGAVGWAPLAIGALVSLGTGVAALVWLLGVIRRGRLHRFAYYCAAAGVATLLAVAAGVL